MNIAVYGGSFNPPHIGHVEAAHSVSRTLRPDRLLIIPDHQPPHKELSEDSPSPEERLALCRLAFQGVAGAEVSDMELKREGASFTAETVEELRRRYPKDELTLVVGTDMFLSFEKWRRFDYLLDECSLAVLPRSDADLDALRQHAGHMRERYGAKVLLLPHMPVELSSSEVRSCLSRRLGSELLPSAVYEEIIRKRYYGAKPELSWLREKASALLKPKRIAHVIGCEYEAVKLARRWGEDPENAAEAAILHDITKKLSLDEQLNLCEKYAIIVDHAVLRFPAILHAITGAALAQGRFGVSEEVAGAIRWHTTGKADMTLLEKIVYLADCIEPGRDYPSVEKLRSLALLDIDAAMAMALERSLAYIRERGEKPFSDTVEAAAWYTRKNTVQED